MIPLSFLPARQRWRNFYASHEPSFKFMLPAPLKPFIPEYQPTIGEVDSSVKVQRPDGVGDFLGLVVLDEHGPEQSNPSTLEM
ncbi:putative intraflagellar transport protein 46 [Blattamonas nauphoetae]|uniref:Intraflagellar transport protein 46 n=1 Tax=Blattamonas nauphoetae TaxID=2049346 RepID=A0ABQ9WWY4_9EUKA|nr:putative intraflagellar transport protein 46 [Blattamonas nauphoetae]